MRGRDTWGEGDSCGGSLCWCRALPQPSSPAGPKDTRGRLQVHPCFQQDSSLVSSCLHPAFNGTVLLSRARPRSPWLIQSDTRTAVQRRLSSLRIHEQTREELPRAFRPPPRSPRALLFKTAANVRPALPNKKTEQNMAVSAK